MSGQFGTCFSTSLQETYETKRKEFLCELQKKEEEMRQMFVNKVKETESELKEKEREVSMADNDSTRQIPTLDRTEFFFLFCLY